LNHDREEVAMFEEHTVEELISTWLEVTKGRSLQLGISREEALGRARDILPRIRAEAPPPEEMKCDEDFKNVLYALVNLVSGSSYEVAEERALDASAVGEFIRCVWTASDEFGEKEQLLSDCEEIAKLSFTGPAKRLVTSPGALDEKVAASPALPWTPPPGADASEEEIRIGFWKELPLLHRMLASCYGVSENQGVEFEKVLYAWFVRFRKRNPGGSRSKDSALLASACLRFAASCDLARDVAPNSSGGATRATPREKASAPHRGRAKRQRKGKGL